MNLRCAIMALKIVGWHEVKKSHLSDSGLGAALRRHRAARRPTFRVFSIASFPCLHPQAKLPRAF